MSVTRFFIVVNYPATPKIYTLSLHGALPILGDLAGYELVGAVQADQPGADDQDVAQHPGKRAGDDQAQQDQAQPRSEEHTSELQSRQYLVCRLLLEKKI